MRQWDAVPPHSGRGVTATLAAVTEAAERKAMRGDGGTRWQQWGAPGERETVMVETRRSRASPCCYESS